LRRKNYVSFIADVVTFYGPALIPNLKVFFKTRLLSFDLACLSFGETTERKSAEKVSRII
jgi:hypothetical protein